MRLTDGSCDSQELQTKTIRFHGSGIRPKISCQDQSLLAGQCPLKFCLSPSDAFKQFAFKPS